MPAHDMFIPAARLTTEVGARAVVRGAAMRWEEERG
jgi:hypothetical protein